VNLTNQQIQDFIDAWKGDFNETLSFEEARAEATRLLDFFAQFAEGLTAIRDRKEEVNTPDESDIKKAWRKTAERRRLPQ
jgi:archaellum biogenesis protein FlaJ (TadC family)